jgi:general secretion pathway protein E
LPQDGRASVQVGRRQIDLRIASMPTSFGERIVVRLLDKSARLYQLSEIGMDGTTLDNFRSLIRIEHGLLLVTGPTGSGKSTTLYAALGEISSSEHNTVTLEDPIEYQLEGISQTQINTKKGMTFASGLRSVLRQDPDIIMVGEIRDEETAVMAVQAALTGHLVFSTLHTNDAASAIARLLDLGIESYLIASSLVGVMAQRLIRRNCESCTLPISLTDEQWKSLGLPDSLRGQCNARQGTGCDRCRGSGYSGRIGIYELLLVSEPIRRMIQQRTRSSEIRDLAVSNGMCLLRASGLTKVFEGTTTLEEVARVTMRTEL